MILITFEGLDPFVTGRYSREHLKNLASLFETKEEEISFFVPNGTIVHEGIEQTSWNIVVKVECSMKYQGLEKNVAAYLLKTLKDFAIHCTVLFSYHDERHLHSFVNEKYPLYLSHDEIQEAEEALEEAEEEVYTGDIFAEHKEELEELEKTLEGKAKGSKED